MDTMSREGWDPNVALWQEPGTIIHEVVHESKQDIATGEWHKIYCNVPVWSSKKR